MSLLDFGQDEKCKHSEAEVVAARVAEARHTSNSAHLKRSTTRKAVSSTTLGGLPRSRSADDVQLSRSTSQPLALHEAEPVHHETIPAWQVPPDDYCCRCLQSDLWFCYASLACDAAAPLVVSNIFSSSSVLQHALDALCRQQHGVSVADSWQQDLYQERAPGPYTLLLPCR